MKRAVILGGGVSGKAAQRLCRALGIESAILNDGEAETLPPCDLVIASPGVHPLRSKLYQLAQQSKAPMTSEMCFGFHHLGIPCAAVTGTNGKTTTTELTTSLLCALGVKAVACGNIGRPVADVAAEMIEAGAKIYDAAVIEVSSFQLELAENFSPDAAVLLNLASDHEDRYRGGFAEYAAVKRRIFDHVKQPLYGLSMPDECVRRVTVNMDTVYIDGAPFLELDKTLLGAPHNRENLAAALELVLRLVPAPDMPKLAAAVRAFKPGAHRIEKEQQKRGVLPRLRFGQRDDMRQELLRAGGVAAVFVGLQRPVVGAAVRREERGRRPVKLARAERLHRFGRSPRKKEPRERRDRRRQQRRLHDPDPRTAVRRGVELRGQLRCHIGRERAFEQAAERHGARFRAERQIAFPFGGGRRFRGVKEGVRHLPFPSCGSAPTGGEHQHDTRSFRKCKARRRLFRKKAAFSRA